MTDLFPRQEIEVCGRQIVLHEFERVDGFRV